MQNKLWQGMVAVVLGGAVTATVVGGASCGSSYNSTGTAGSYAGNGGRAGSGGGSGGNANQTMYNMQLTGAQEVPANPSPAMANVKVTLDQATGVVTVTGTFMGLSSAATVAHIHGPAAVGSNAPVLMPLTVTSATSGMVSGTGNMSATQMNDMTGGMTYVNIHTMSYPDGEIRAQIVP